MAVRRKFTGVSSDHDRRRHHVSLDLPLGGDGKLMGTQLYYTQVKIGSPPRDYYVCVDTGSDLFWVKCDQKALYYPRKSQTATILPCGHDLCLGTCKTGSQCAYHMSYGGGSSSTGYLVIDQVQFDVVSGNFTTLSINLSLVFGCGVHQYGALAEAGVGLDGILGFGRSNFSLISQLSKSGLVQKSFSHCLDSDYGGGIFIIGRVKHPIVKTTPLTKNRDHYNVNMLAIEVDKYILELGSGKGMETIIDSGTTLAYLPEEIYEVILNKILSIHQHLGFYSVKDLHCFHYNATSVDVDFPTITLHFDSSLQFLVYPREYLIQYQLHSYCLGWRSSRSLAKELQNIALLGDMVLSNKFVHYDIENEAIGWKDYDCFSLVRVQDQNSSTIYEVGPHLIWAPPHDNSAAARNDMGCVVFFLIVLSASLFCQVQDHKVN